jgi:hypothetical protein
MLSGDSSFDLAIKLPGAAFTSGNCYCYAMSWFRGAVVSCQLVGGGGACTVLRQRRRAMRRPAVTRTLRGGGGV